MKKAKTPEAPNYTAIANQQAALAKENWRDELQASRANQVGPEGTLNWTKDANGNWTQTVSMAPERQETWDTLQGKIQDQLRGYNTNQVDISGAPAMPTIGGYNQQVIDTMRALQAPTLERARAAKEAKLAAMGIGTGSGSAWNTEQGNLYDAENRADLEAILAGYGQGNTEFEQGMGLHQQGVSDILSQEQANQAKMSGLMGLGDSFRLPTFENYATPSMSGAATPDLLNASQAGYKAAVDKANAASASNPWNQLVGIGTTLGAAYLTGGASLAAQAAANKKSPVE